jgi:hypothetical protein
MCDEHISKKVSNKNGSVDQVGHNNNAAKNALLQIKKKIQKWYKSLRNFHKKELFK